MVEILSRNSSSGVDTTTLGGTTALIVDTLLANVARNFMAKNIKSIFWASGANNTDMYALVLHDGDASAAEVAAALSDTSQDLEDSIDYRNGQLTVRIIWDIQVLEYDADTGYSVARMIQWKLPPKGIPVLKGRGLAISVFNPRDTAFANGPVITHLGKLMGGWF